MKKSVSIYFLFFNIIIFIGACQQKNQNSRQSDNNEPFNLKLEKISELTMLIENDSSNSRLFIERAKMFCETENYKSALKDALTAIELDSVFPDYFVTLSDIYLGLQRLQSSLDALDKATVINPKYIPALIKKAETYIIFRDYKKALEFIDEIIKTDDLEPKAYFLRGVVFLENNDTLRSIRNFQKAIDVDQDYFEAHLQLGLLYAEKKNKLAVDYFNNALNIRPDDADVSYYLGLFYQETGSYEQAIKIYEGLVIKDPAFYFALYNIGYINLVYLNDYDKAIEYFTKVIEIKPDYTDAFYNRGFAYELKKDVENSRNDYKKTMELTPNYQKAIDGLNRIDEYLGGNIN